MSGPASGLVPAALRVLLITEAFPPAPVVGSFRAANLARAFRDQGHTVHVITLLGGEEPNAQGVYEDGITWERVHAWPGPRQAYLGARRLLRLLPAAKRGETAPVGDAAPASRGGIRALLVGIMTLPDDRQGFVPAAMRAAWPKRRAVDLVYSTAPAFSALLAGRAVRSLTRAPWYAELRDPWVGNASRTKHLESPAVGRLDERLERFCLGVADGIVTVTPSAAEHYRRRFPGGPRVFCALNGIPHIRPAERVRRPGPLRVVYAGSVYPPRNPTPLVAALLRAYESSGVAAELELIFAGASGWAEAPGLEQATSAVVQGVTVRRLPWLPQAEAQALIDEADLLLLPAQQWQLQVPNKLFDYLGSRVPVLALAESNSDTAAMLQRAGGHFVAFADDTPERIDGTAAQALAAAVHNARAGDEDVLREWQTRVQLGYLVREISAETNTHVPAPGELAGIVRSA